MIDITLCNVNFHRSYLSVLNDFFAADFLRLTEENQQNGSLPLDVQDLDSEEGKIYRFNVELHRRRGGDLQYRLLDGWVSLRAEKGLVEGDVLRFSWGEQNHGVPLVTVVKLLAAAAAAAAVDVPIKVDSTNEGRCEGSVKVDVIDDVADEAEKVADAVKANYPVDDVRAVDILLDMSRSGSVKVDVIDDDPDEGEAFLGLLAFFEAAEKDADAVKAKYPVDDVTAAEILLDMSGSDLRIRKPAPWQHTEPIAQEELNRMREEFWDTRSQHGGRREIWDALKAAAEANSMQSAQAVLNSSGITANADMTICNDEKGREYILPVYVLIDPENLIIDLSD